MNIIDRMGSLARTATGAPALPPRGALERAGAPTVASGDSGAMLSGVLSPGGEPARRAAADYLKAYSTMPWLRAALGRISWDVAATQWCLFAPKGNARRELARVVQRCNEPIERRALIAKAQEEGKLEEITAHPVLDLMAQANPIHTGMVARRLAQIHVDAVGESFWLIERDKLGMPSQLWPMPPNWVKRTPTPTDPRFRVEFKGWRGDVPATEVIWFCDADPANPYGRGSGVATSLGDELETDEYAARTMKATFYNRAKPDLIVSPKGGDTLKGDQVDRLEEGWNRHNRGFWKVARPYFLKRSVDVKELNTNFRSLQLIELREFERDTCLQVFGVSPEILGIIRSGSSRASVTTADLIYARRVQMPRLEMMRPTLQQGLVDQFDDRLVIDYVSPVTTDQELALNAAKVAPWALTQDEWRRKAGEEPIGDDGGDVRMVPQNLVPVTSLSDMAQQTPASGKGSPGAETAGPVKASGTATSPALDTRRAVFQEVVDGFATARDWDARDTWLSLEREAKADEPEATRIGDALAPEWRDALVDAWKGLTADVAAVEAALKANRPDEVIDAFGGAAALARAITEPTVERAKSAFMRGAQMAFERDIATAPTTREPISISFTDVNPAAIAWANEHAAALVAGIGATATESIQALILASNALGVPVRELARRIVEDGIVGLLPKQIEANNKFVAAQRALGVSEDLIARRAAKYAAAQLRFRASMIARTEVMWALNAGQFNLWQHAANRGVLDKNVMREWITVLDGRADDDCLELDGEQVGLQESFSLGVDAPPLHPLCLPADSLVAAGGRITACSERWYEGDLAVIGTASGKQLSCTPNHPVLTDKGWVGAGSLNEGDNVISCVGSELVFPDDLNDVHMPTPIKEVTDSFRVEREIAFRSVITATPHFHGDGIDGEVAVVWADSALRNGPQVPFAEGIENLPFKRGHIPVGFAGLGSFQQFGRRLLAAAARGVSRGNHSLAFLKRHAFPSFYGGGADLVAAGMTRDHMGAALLGSVEAVPEHLGIAPAGPAHRIGHGLHPDFDPATDENVANPGATYAVPGREILQRHVGEVILDKVEFVTLKAVACHVYNLETETGWYVADGIITHNCRCSMGLVR